MSLIKWSDWKRSIINGNNTPFPVTDKIETSSNYIKKLYNANPFICYFSKYND